MKDMPRVRGRQYIAIGGKGDRIEPRSLALHCQQLLAAFDIPEGYCFLAVVAGHKPFPIRREAYPPGMSEDASKPGDLLCRACLKEPHVVPPATKSEELAIGRKRCCAKPGQ